MLASLFLGYVGICCFKFGYETNKDLSQPMMEGQDQIVEEHAARPLKSDVVQQEDIKPMEEITRDYEDNKGDDEMVVEHTAKRPRQIAKGQTLTKEKTELKPEDEPINEQVQEPVKEELPEANIAPENEEKDVEGEVMKVDVQKVEESEDVKKLEDKEELAGGMLAEEKQVAEDMNEEEPSTLEMHNGENRILENEVSEPSEIRVKKSSVDNKSEDKNKEPQQEEPAKGDLVQEAEEIPEEAHVVEQESSQPQKAKEQSNAEEDKDSGEEAKAKPLTSSSGILMSAIKSVFLSSIKKIIASNQLEEAKDFREVQATGQVGWVKTHFIFMIDCSGSMKEGDRWDAVVAGYDSCLKLLAKMEKVSVTALTFDIRVNLFCQDKTPAEAIEQHSELPFTGKGTNYKGPLETAINIAKNSVHNDYLLCMLFLSDGIGGYPEDAINELKTMRQEGRKILFYTIACATDEDQDMIRMAENLEGEHYKVIDAEASSLVFSTILNV